MKFLFYRERNESMTRREDNNVLESRRNELVNEIDQLEKELKQREEQLPVHSIRPIRF